MKSRIFFLTSVLLGVYLILYLLLQVVSVNSVLSMIGQNADQETKAAIERQYHLDQPAWKRLALHFHDLVPLSICADDENSLWHNTDAIQYGHRLVTIGGKSLWLKLPYLGRSFQSQELVSLLIWEKFKTTFLLTMLAMFFASFLGIAMGVLAAIYHQRWPDQVILSISSLGISAPSFFLGIMLALIFGYYLSSYTGLSFRGSLIEYDDQGLASLSLKNLILPVLALSLRPLAIMLDTLKEDYIRTAMAKGLSYPIVVYKHALINALNPVVSSIAGWFGSLLAGAYFIEIIFDMKGLGALTVNALMKFDTPLVLGASLLIACNFVFIYFSLDFIYRWLDPRVK
jgi:peptide/nickel transport system permease protein